MTTTASPAEIIENLAFAKVIEVDGSHIVAELDRSVLELSRVYGGETYPIGQFGSIVKIHFGRKLLFGYVARLRMKSEYLQEHGVGHTDTEARIVEADLFGEGEWILNSEVAPAKWELRFERGISTYPLPQQSVYLTPRHELQFIYRPSASSTIVLGEHVGSGGTKCYADMDEMLGKHIAVLGSTGSGKSGTVASILHAILDRGQHEKLAKWNPQIVILDPHNEYATAFPNRHRRLSTEEQTLSLPYWLLNLQESVALFLGRSEFAATSQTNIVKTAILNARRTGAVAIGFDINRLTVDSPVPFTLDAFRAEVVKQKPDNKNQKDHEPYNNVLNKLDVLCKDARLSFLMNSWDGKSDGIADVVNQFFGKDNDVRIVDLSGVPNEVAGLCSAAIARLLFNVKLWQTVEERKVNPVLLVCEEAHRYVPNRGEAQYEAAQEAIKRLAKEGRKYGIGLMLVSQRPSDVEATVLSQCNTWIVLRLTNETDRDHVKAILPDSLSGMTKVLSGLRQREAIFVGQAAMLPSRILITALGADRLPNSHDISFDKGWRADVLKDESILDAANRWRSQSKMYTPPKTPQTLAAADDDF